MADPLGEVAVRLLADFAGHATLAEILAVIARCRNGLDEQSAAAAGQLPDSGAQLPAILPGEPPCCAVPARGRTGRLLRLIEHLSGDLPGACFSAQDEHL